MKLANFLTFGFSLFILVFYNGCKEQDSFSVKSRWIYINLTDSSITYYPERAEFNLGSEDTIVFEEISEAVENTRPENLQPPLDPLVFFYGLNLCDTTSIDNPLTTSLENYEIKEIGVRDFEYTFRFTDEMLSRAKICR